MNILVNANWVYSGSTGGDRAWECGAPPHWTERTHTTHGTTKELEKSPLGILTKYCAMPDFKGLAENQLRRSMRYALQNEAVKLLPSERVRFCLRHRICKDNGVEVRFNQARGKAHYSNVQRCGSVWVCPVCSAQISEGRRQELKQAMTYWRKQGGAVYLLTLTTPHYKGDDLELTLKQHQKALKRFFGNREPRGTLELLGRVGHIRATEVTYGENGWHPHYHILLFFKAPLADPEALRGFLASAWQRYCVKSGLKAPSIKHGCDLQDGTFADKYVGKWGLEDELTKGHIKKGRKGSQTPWDLLRQSEGGCDNSGRLFKTFAKAFKGKRQLSWSNGLKDLLLVDEVTDEELAAVTDKDSERVRELDMEFWRLLKRFKERARYLAAVEHDELYGSQRADNLILELAGRYVKECVPELMQHEGLHKVRADVLRL